LGFLFVLGSLSGENGTKKWYDPKYLDKKTFSTGWLVGAILQIGGFLLLTHIRQFALAFLAPSLTLLYAA
jgi:hypothetical protein